MSQPHAPAPESEPMVIKIPSQPGYLCAVRAMVETLARQWGFDDEQAGRVVLAVDEALVNVIRHGYRGADDRPIWLKIGRIGSNGHTAGRAGLSVIIEDECDPIDPQRIRGRDLDDVKPGGLGVHIIREAMDNVTFAQRDDGRGMRLKMEKFLKPTSTSAAKG